MPQPVAQSYSLRKFRCSPGSLGFRASIKEQWQRNIFTDTERGQQVEILKNEFFKTRTFVRTFLLTFHERLCYTVPMSP